MHKRTLREATDHEALIKRMVILEKRVDSLEARLKKKSGALKRA